MADPIPKTDPYRSPTVSEHRDHPSRADGFLADDRSLRALVADLRDEAARLLRQEAALARTEMTDKAQMVGRNVGSLIGGALTAFAGGIVFLIALSALLYVAMLTWDVAPFWAIWIAPAVVGVLVMLIGWGMIAGAKRKLRPENLKPHETTESLKETKQWAQNKRTSATTA